MRILYVCHDIGYWRAHRDELAARMRAMGDETALLCGVPPADISAAKAALSSHPLRVDHVALVPLARLWLDPRHDLLFGRAVRRCVRRFRPDAIHLLTLKPILFGGAALRLSRRVPHRVIATFPGLGRVFAGDEADRRQRLVVAGLRWSLNTRLATAVFENANDRDRLVTAGVVPHERSAVVNGAGFAATDFPLQPMPPGPSADRPLKCLFASRLLNAKGLDAVIEAAQRLAEAKAPVRITIAGTGDGDPDAVPEARLQALAGAGIIDFLGCVPVDAMAAEIARHHVVLLPTRYPEGTPRILAEAGAVGRPSIVSNHPGCTAFVRDGREGIVIDPADGPTLATAIAQLVGQPGRVRSMGLAAQQRAVQGGFSIDQVARTYRRLYQGLPIEASNRGDGSPASDAQGDLADMV